MKTITIEVTDSHYAWLKDRAARACRRIGILSTIESKAAACLEIYIESTKAAEGDPL